MAKRRGKTVVLAKTGDKFRGWRIVPIEQLESRILLTGSTLVSDDFTLNSSRAAGTALDGSSVELPSTDAWSNTDGGSSTGNFAYAGDTTNGYITVAGQSFQVGQVQQTIGSGTYTISANMWPGADPSGPWTAVGFFNSGGYPLYGDPLWMLIKASGNYQVWASGVNDQSGEMQIANGTVPSSNWSQANPPPVSLTWDTVTNTASASVDGTSVMSGFSLNTVSGLMPSLVTGVGFAKDGTTETDLIIDNFAVNATTGASPASQLTFASGPTATQAGATIPPVTVDIEDSSGSLDTSDNSNVTLTIASGPAGATLDGSVTVAAVNGVATFSGLSITTAGTYTLTATDGSDTAATSTSFQIAAVTTDSANNLFIGTFSTSGSIGEYTPTGTAVNANLVTGLGNPYGSALSGSDLFVANESAGTIGEYTTSGATVNASLISGLTQPEEVAVSGSDLFVSLYGGAVAEYTTSGATVNASLISGLSGPTGIVIDGSDLFVENGTGGTIGEYTTAGATVNADLISGLNEPDGFAIQGSDLFVSNEEVNSTVGEYTTSGTTINASLIGGLDDPVAVAVSGSNLFVANFGDGTIGEYTTSGTIINASLISGLSSPDAIVLAGNVATSQLAFASQPVSTTGNTPLGPVIVDVDDLSGNLLTSDDSAVTVAIASGPAGAILSGTTTVAAVNGVATFSNLSITAAGSYLLTATDGSDTAVTTNAFTIASPSAAYPVETIGGLDPTFGTGGIASNDVGFTATEGEAIYGTQSILIGPIGTSPTEAFGVTRYNGDGSLDTSFGTAGVATTSFGGTDDVPAAVDVLASGNILVAGTATTFVSGEDSGSEFAVAEYNADGSLDTSFGNGTGEVLISFSTSGGLTNDVLNAMAVGARGTIYLGGSSDANGKGNSDFAVAALNAGGTLDAGFGGGKVLLDFAGGDDAINSVALQTNGDVVAAGSATVGGVTEIALARFLTTGIVDKHFGVKGLVTTNVRGVYDSASSVVIQSKGQIVLGGISASGSSSDFVVERYTSAGRLDRTFGGSGTVITSFAQPSAITQVVLQANGEIVASGKTTADLSDFVPDELDLAIARYLPNGALDSSFAGTGKVILDLNQGEITASETEVNGLALTAQPEDSTNQMKLDQYQKNKQGVTVITKGGKILDAGNSGTMTKQGQLIAMGVDLVARVLSSLPASVLGGIKGSVSVSIAESGTTQAIGSVTLEIQFAADSEGDGAVTAKDIAEKINLRQGQFKSYKVSFSYPAGLASSGYYLVATVENPSTLTDLNLNNNTAPSSSAVTIAPPTIVLAGSGLAAATAFDAGKSVGIVLNLTNDGNVLAKGKIAVELFLSSDQTTADGTQIVNESVPVSLAAGKAHLFKLKFVLPDTAMAGSFDLLAMIDPTDSLGTIDHSNALVSDAIPVVVT